MVTLGFLSTYPPTPCGLATFTASLRAALPDGAAGGVVRVVDAVGASRPADVVGQLVPGSAASCRAAAGLLNRQDAVIIQHEYGIYGGADGDDVLGVLAMLSVPAVVVLHTVLTAPTPHQRFVLNAVVAAAAAVVVMTETARARLIAGYRVDAHRIAVIPHGAPDTDAEAATQNRDRQILTWGLLGPGKGIEWGIEAMALLDDLLPRPHYVVAGRTHPKVLALQGERYRRALQARARELGVQDRVRFDARYLDARSLRDLVARAQVVLLPYDSRDQITSGVLVEAITARIPVVATRFPHAVELLADGAGILVDHQDPAAIATAVRTILTDRRAAAGMATAAGTAARTLGWASVADQYRRLADGLVRVPASVVA
ncbi:MAG TPA: glycosyltransferase [Pseudonocardiaceae bacterium]